MGKIKKLLDFQFDFELNQDDIDEELMSRNDYDYQYEKWLKSKEFVEYVNGELDSTRPKYSEYDIMSATRYASDTLHRPSEVGKKYMICYFQKNREYLL